MPDDEPVSLEDRKLLIRERLDNLQLMFEEEAKQQKEVVKAIELETKTKIISEDNETVEST